MGLKIAALKPKNNDPGFTIVELLVVIVVIGILAAITIVSYTGITKKANESTLKSDLANSKKQFALYYTEHGVYPTGLNGNKCPTGTTDPSPDTNYCLKPSAGDLIEISEADGNKYKLTATKGTLTFSITEDSTPSVAVLLPESDWITVGTQRWARKNLNVGTKIDGNSNQTNNSIIEKYCYDDLEGNCINYGALYQWDEAMQYSRVDGAKGVCPSGSHIPTDFDWKVLEKFLGMTQLQADAKNWRGTNQGLRLMVGGNTDLDIPFAGHRFTIDPKYRGIESFSYLWTSTESVDAPDYWAWRRAIVVGNEGVFRDEQNKVVGFSLRCLGDS